MKNKIIEGLFWKLLERFGVQGCQFVIQIILARMLAPDDYGVLSLMIIFTSLANVFVQSGLNTALVQNKEVKDEDYSSVFWVSLTIAVFLFLTLYLGAPWIAIFYNIPDIIEPFRVISLMLIPGAFNSVQVAKLSREMNFKEIFRCNLVAIIVSGVIGIVLAYFGAGVWALVAQSLTNVVVICIVMCFAIRWRPQLLCNFSRIKVLFSYGWKLLVSSLIDTLYQDLSSLVIGKKYDSGTLGYYNRGKQFPQFIIGAINGTVQSVMLPAMSKRQDNTDSVKSLMRKSISLSAYIIFPMMAGLVAIAESLVKLLLTEKWLPSVPFLQIYCFVLAFYPVHSCNLQAINAMGRSDIFLKLEIIKKVYGVIILLIAVFCFDSPIAIALSGIVTTLISWVVNSYPNKQLVSYSYEDQFWDIIPSFLMSMVMCLGVLLIGKIGLGTITTMCIQIISGICIYLLLSVVFKPKPYIILIEFARKFMKRGTT